ncbi:HRDC domain-containing protein [Flavobacterium sp.]|uniref:HRDC domain-containing protein n=1 Tax=Flavobacterium sp. TaxID=239 RepID=UPI00286D05F3|nr:HRDC domain-containing protein [Flavobacterium sp.]
MSIKVCNIRLDKEHLQPDQNSMNAFLDSVNVKLTSSNFVTTGTTDYWSVLIFYESKKETQTPIIENQLTGVEKELYEVLKTWRNNKATELNLKHFMISHNSELMNIAIKKPKTISALKKIKGFGEVKTAKFGQEILSVLNS